MHPLTTITRKAVTNAEGAFSFAGLWPDTFLLRTTREGEVAGNMDHLVVTPEQSAQPVRLVVRTASMVRGRLVDLLGRPLVGWRVALRPADTEPVTAIVGPQMDTTGIGEPELRTRMLEAG